MINTIIASVIIFGLLIFVHELGHFITARLVRMKVLEFSIGFGKELIGWQKESTRYALRVFPLGGACRLLGEDGDETSKEGSFQSKPLLSRFAVIFAGPFMNFLLAVVLFSLVFFFFLGVPQNQNTQIGEVLPESQAFAAGLEPGDIILAIDHVAMKNWNDIISYINASPGQQITLQLQRGKHELFIPVVPKNEAGRGLIGIAPVYKKYRVFSSLGLGFSNTWFLIKLIFVSLYQMVTGAIPADVAGPVGIIAVVAEATKTGLSNLFYLAALISINLGIINLLPIPALDGSRIFFLALEGIRGKPLDPKKEGFIHFIGFTLLIVLMILIAFQDITRLLF